MVSDQETAGPNYSEMVTDPRVERGHPHCAGISEPLWRSRDRGRVETWTVMVENFARTQRKLWRAEQKERKFGVLFWSLSPQESSFPSGSM